MRWLTRPASCRDIEPLLWGHGAPSRDSDQVREVDAHLAECASCRMLSEQYQRATLIVEEAANDRVPDSRRGWEEVANAIRVSESAGPSRSRAALRTAFGVAAVAAALWLLFPIRTPMLPGNARTGRYRPTQLSPTARAGTPQTSNAPTANPTVVRPMRSEPSLVLPERKQQNRRRYASVVRLAHRRQSRKLEPQLPASPTVLAALDGMNPPDSANSPRVQYVAPDTVPAVGEVEASYVLEGASEEAPVVEARGW